MKREMNYYLYISQSKVDMLYPQIGYSGEVKKTSKFATDIKVISASIESQRVVDQSLMSRLQVVDKHLSDTSDPLRGPSVGPWVRGKAMAKFLDLGDGAIIFIAKSGRRFVGLGGSKKNLTGNGNSFPAGVSYSFLSHLAERLWSVTEQNFEQTVAMDEEDVKRQISLGTRQGFHAWMEAIEGIWQRSHAPEEPIYYLGRRLARAKDRMGCEFTLATPIYVALDD